MNMNDTDIAPQLIDEEYEREHHVTLPRLNQVFAAVAVFAFSSLYPVDPFLPDLVVPLRTLLIIRTAVVASNILCLGLTFTQLVKRHPDMWATFNFFQCAISVTILVVCTGGTLSPYRDAMLVLYLFSPTLLPFKFSYFLPAAVTSTVLYPEAIWASNTMGHPAAFLSSISFLSACCCMGSIAPFFLDRFRRASVKSRLLLARERETLKEAFATIQEQQKNVSEDLSQARLFQQKILRPLPENKGVDFAALYRPADFLGGDFYDVTEMGPDWYRIFIADVTGHGTQAAMRTMILQQQLERASRQSKSPWDLMASINDAVVEAFGSMTLNYCALCIDLRRQGDAWAMSGTNAGLPDPTLILGAKLTKLEEEGGTYQGIFTDVTYPRFERTLKAGDGLVLATDGIVDLLDHEGATWIPDGARFTNALGNSAVAALNGLAARIPDPPPLMDRSDDLTMVVMRIPAA